MSILHPILALIALTFAVTIMMGRTRYQAIASGKVKIKDIALGQSAWDETATKWGNNYANLFQIPMLFYVLGLIAMQTGQDGLVMTLIGWAFFATRLAHTYIHVTINHVGRRFRAFVAGNLVLLVMFLVIIIGLFI